MQNFVQKNKLFALMVVIGVVFTVVCAVKVTVAPDGENNMTDVYEIAVLFGAATVCWVLANRNTRG